MAVLRDGTLLNGGMFIVGALLSSGGMGEVYLGHQRSMRRYVAIKILKPEYAADAQVLALFQREALAAGRLRHPNVLPVIHFDFDSEVGVHFLAMDYVPGGHTLAERLGGRLDPAEVARVIEGIAGALELLDAELGAYFVMIDSPEEEASEAPYRLRARRIGEPAFVWQWGPVEPAVEADDPPARSREARASAASSSGMGLPVLPWPPPSPPAVGLPPWTVPPSVYRQPVPSAGTSAATTSTVAPVTSARPPDVASVTQAATRGTEVTSSGQSNGDRSGNRGRSRRED